MIDAALYGLTARAAEARILDWWGRGYRLASHVTTQSTLYFRVACPDCGGEPTLVDTTETCPCGWRRQR